eukprot:CAMPEP_0197934282 /NCGR_PEP_ID=MMETSP1439-20131203/111516_1 /TAXON_ID=66791 /ORGANISM="Gonyaulax spinifera, Strain CCMP409" /LENGTH=48 /DNA_ID= /DNA_START= /DNA_END= /DNA_ORIENTATION=
MRKNTTQLVDSPSWTPSSQQAEKLSIFDVAIVAEKTQTENTRKSRPQT